MIVLRILWVILQSHTINRPNHPRHLPSNSASTKYFHIKFGQVAQILQSTFTGYERMRSSNPPWPLNSNYITTNYPEQSFPSHSYVSPTLQVYTQRFLQSLLRFLNAQYLCCPLTKVVGFLFLPLGIVALDGSVRSRHI